MATTQHAKRSSRSPLGKRRSPTESARPAARSVNGKSVNAWQDDPISGLPTLGRKVPNLSVSPLRYRFKGATPPAGAYPTGTRGFRYWTAAEALRRGADFWAPILGVKRWQPGAVLKVGLDEGVDLNAYYDRSELAFFHDTAGGKTIFSGESPDVVCHEMGHACLDAHRPELWDAPYVEAGAFHESFGDMSAMLSALQLTTVRHAALSGVAAHKSSPLSRLAEQLGWAIRQTAPTQVNRNCLRDACNSFKYVNPATLPDSAPASRLCAEVHSFSRVFTGAFYEILGGMVRARSKKPKEADLAAAAADAARLLLDATAAAPIQPAYFAQVAAHMVDADTVRFGGKYRSVLADTFVRRKMLSPASVKPMLAFKGRIPREAMGLLGAAAARPATPEIHKVRLSGAEFGLADQPLIVHAPVEHKPFVAVSAALSHRPRDVMPDVEQATHRFVRMLFAHDRVESAPGAKRRGIARGVEPRARRRTHVLIPSPEGLRLVRRQFDCSCGCTIAEPR